MGRRQVGSFLRFNSDRPLVPNLTQLFRFAPSIQQVLALAVYWRVITCCNAESHTCHHCDDQPARPNLALLSASQQREDQDWRQGRSAQRHIRILSITHRRQEPSRHGIVVRAIDVHQPTEAIKLRAEVAVQRVAAAVLLDDLPEGIVPACKDDAACLIDHLPHTAHAIHQIIRGLRSELADLSDAIEIRRRVCACGRLQQFDLAREATGVSRRVSDATDPANQPRPAAKAIIRHLGESGIRCASVSLGLVQAVGRVVGIANRAVGGTRAIGRHLHQVAVAVVAVVPDCRFNIDLTTSRCPHIVG